MARPTNAKRIVRRALKILNEKENWMKGQLAKDDQNNPRNPIDADATCFCLAGAFQRAAYTMGIIKAESTENEFDERWSEVSTQIEKLIDPFILEYYNPDAINFIAFNDSVETKYENIITLLKQAGA